MARHPRFPRRYALLAFGLVVALVGCGDSSGSAPATAAVESMPGAESAEAGTPLAGISFEVHRDPG